MTDRTNVTPSRRALLRGAALATTAAAAAGLMPIDAQAITSTDPVVILAAAVAIKQAAVTAAGDAVMAIYETAEKAAGVGPVPGGGSNAAMDARQARNAKVDSAMDRLGLSEAYREAGEAEDRAVQDFCSLQADFGRTEATTMQGVVLRLRYVADWIDVPDEPAEWDHEHRALMGAIADLERLTGKAAQS